jgi:hypothetical protein
MKSDLSISILNLVVANAGSNGVNAITNIEIEMMIAILRVLSLLYTLEC